MDSVTFYLQRQFFYDSIKEAKINQLKDSIKLKSGDNIELYNLYSMLYDEYRSYIYDSAYVYVEKLLDVSNMMKDKDKIALSKIRQGFSFLSSGLFCEASDILTGLDLSDCSRETLIEYFLCKSRLYYDMADFNNMVEFRKKYNKIGNSIIDSALQILPINTKKYWLAEGLKEMKSEKYLKAIESFEKVISGGDFSQHDLAIATSSIAYIQGLLGNRVESKKYLIEAVIADVKASTKETVALRNLARILYEERDVTNSVVFIRQALVDAEFYNARHRQLEISNILPIIEGERINMIKKERDRIAFFVIFILILLIILLITLSFIWKSKNKIEIAKREIQSMNDDLLDANRIKNEYIGYFFSQNAEFIEKIGFLQRWVNKQVQIKQYSELKNFPENLDVEKERAALYKRFDQVFLKIFPNFVDEFNKLLKPEKQIQVKKGELLSPELRIYALIRLGINENEKIAHFLNYSVNTIYTYKTKIRGKSNVPSNEFIKKVMEIKSY
ncbi:MAG: hypothetical protein GX361_01495 [Bacteroidales bacterium]|nr:hypothetical protein [Bacteroidales bacterium]